MHYSSWDLVLFPSQVTSLVLVGFPFLFVLFNFILMSAHLVTEGKKQEPNERTCLMNRQTDSANNHKQNSSMAEGFVSASPAHLIKGEVRPDGQESPPETYDNKLVSRAFSLSNFPLLTIVYRCSSYGKQNCDYQSRQISSDLQMNRIYNGI